MAAIGISLALWASVLILGLRLIVGVKPDEITFAVMGIIQVFAGVLILTGVAPRFASWVISKSFLQSDRAVAKVSLPILLLLHCVPP